MKTRTVSTRLTEDELSLLDDLAAESGLDRSSMARRLVRRGMRDQSLDLALRAYAEQRVTLGRAAELAGVSPWDFLARLGAAGGTIHYDVAEFEEDLDAQP